MPRYTGPIYRPSAQVLLWIRLDELTQTGALRSRLGRAREGLQLPQPEQARPREAEAGSTRDLVDRMAFTNDEIRVTEKAAPDSWVEGPEARERYLDELRGRREALRAQLAGSGGEDASRIEAVDGSSPDERFVRGGIQPRDALIEINGFRTADSCTIQIPWASVPFDPRLVRAAGIELIVGAVSEEEWEAGIHGLTNGDGSLRSQIEQVPAGALGASATRFVGWVDTWGVNYDVEEGDFVTLTCRDYTALFLDTPLADGQRIDLSLPIDEGVRQFIQQYPTLAGMKVVYGDKWETDNVPEERRARAGRDAGAGPGPAPIPGASVAPERRARRGTQTRQVRSGDQRMNLWDYITDVCVQTGVIPLVRDYELRIVNPRTLFTGPGSGPGGRPRRMVYGRNLGSLHFERKLGGIKVPTIEVRAYDPGLGRTRWARYPVPEGAATSGVLGVDNPPAALRANEVTPSGANPDDRVQTFTVRYGTSGEQLAGVARGIFEQIGRQEIEGNLKTNDVHSWDPQAEDGAVAEDTADLLRIRSGDPIELLVAPARSDPRDVVTTMTDLAGFARDQRSAYLQRLGWSQAVADRFAELQDAVGFQTLFRTQNARLHYSADEGIAIEIDFVNFIEVREEASGSAQPPVAAGGTQSHVIQLDPETISPTSVAEQIEQVNERIRFIEQHPLYSTEDQRERDLGSLRDQRDALYDQLGETPTSTG